MIMLNKEQLINILKNQCLSFYKCRKENPELNKYSTFRIELELIQRLIKFLKKEYIEEIDFDFIWSLFLFSRLKKELQVDMDLCEEYSSEIKENDYLELCKKSKFSYEVFNEIFDILHIEFNISKDLTSKLVLDIEETFESMRKKV